MESRKLVLVGLIAVLIVLSGSIVFAQELDLPIGLQRAVEENKQATTDFLFKISIFVAFAAGMLTILSPCSLPLFPVFFSYISKEKKNITKMTLIFSLGFSVAFITLGIIAGLVGEQSISIIQEDWLVTIAGLFIILFGIMSLLGKGFASFIKFMPKTKNDIPGTFLLGIFFALGWTACLGPILGGILGIGAILHNVWYAAILMLFYSLGNMIPLFILAIFYDKLNLAQSKLIKGKLFTFTLGGKKYYVHSTNLFSGILLVLFGTFIIIYKGTALINRIDIFGTRPYFYLLQSKLIEWKYANVLGVLLSLAFILVLWYVLKKKKS